MLVGTVAVVKYILLVKKSNINAFGANQAGQISEIEQQKKVNQILQLSVQTGTKTSQIVPAGLNVLVKQGDIVKTDQALKY